VARDEGQVMIDSGPGGYRNWRRLKRRLENGPVARGEMYLARVPTIDGSGGWLAASAHPFPEDLD
jgi:hypothetical protein